MTWLQADRTAADVACLAADVGRADAVPDEQAASEAISPIKVNPTTAIPRMRDTGFLGVAMVSVL